MKSIFILLIILSPVAAWSQSRVTIHGTIKDAATSEELIGATVFVNELQTGVVADITGAWTLSLPAGNYTMVVSYMGYESLTRNIELTANETWNIQLTPVSTQLEEVVVTGVANIVDNAISVNIDMATIRKMPAFFGEVDILKSIQSLPGVQSAGEGTTGFFVRGGAVDQNLIQLDNATIYNASHLMGFFSVFNSDAIGNAELYKGGIPAQFGGRLSSLLDIHSKEGDRKKFGAVGGIGTIASRFTLEGPIQKDRSSFIVSGRRTYADLFLKASSNRELRNSRLFFYDLNGRADFRIGKNDAITTSTYMGDDVFRYKKTMNWVSGNRTGNVRWGHRFGEKMYADFTGLYSDFNYSLGSTSQTNFKWTASIEDVSMRSDFSYFHNDKSTINFGLASTLHRFSPGKVISDGVERVAMDRKKALESSVYGGSEIKWSDRLSTQAGLRMSIFQNLADTLNTYTGFEPRLLMRWMVDASSSMTFSYDRMYQYIQLASNTTSSFPLDVYFPSDKNIKPQLANQLAVGYFKNLQQNRYEFSAEVFYRNLQNQVDFRDNADLFLNNHLEKEVVAGKGKAYGIELMLKKHEGKLTGWISYSYARSKRQIAEINNSDEYSARQDRPHSLNVVASYQLRPRIQVGANWMFASGMPVTIPVSGYEHDGVMVPIYGERNGYRLPASHRLDLSVTIEGKVAAEKTSHGSWNFSVFNAYAHKNPFTLQTRPTETDPSRNEAVQLSIIGSIIPSVTYNFKF